MITAEDLNSIWAYLLQNNAVYSLFQKLKNMLFSCLGFNITECKIALAKDINQGYLIKGNACCFRTFSWNS
ncbi:hypothetical protein AB1K84_05875 [Mesobacillus foraminis]|uniref:hypothetical protein n=1 Tax=Mesobacillus foraminis TaxID=279826 RepID=UPI0039A36838